MLTNSPNIIYNICTSFKMVVCLPILFALSFTFRNVESEIRNTGIIRYDQKNEHSQTPPLKPQSFYMAMHSRYLGAHENVSEVVLLEQRTRVRRRILYRIVTPYKWTSKKEQRKRKKKPEVQMVEYEYEETVDQSIQERSKVREINSFNIVIIDEVFI